MKLDKWLHIYSNRLGTGYKAEWIDDVRENVRGEWIKQQRHAGQGFQIPIKKCSVCGEVVADVYEYNFCPNCGAQMER